MAIAKIQEAFLNSGGDGTATTATVSLTGVTAGNSLLVYAVCYCNAGNPTLAVSDNVVGTWATPVSQALTASNTRSSIFQCASSPGGTVTVTITSSLALRLNGTALWLAEFSGIGAADQTGTSTSTSGTQPSPTLTPTQAGELVLITNFNNAAAAPSASPSAPWHSQAGGSWFGTAGATSLAYQVVADTSATSGSWTGGGTYNNLGASFVAVGALTTGNFMPFLYGG